MKLTRTTAARIAPEALPSEDARRRYADLIVHRALVDSYRLEVPGKPKGLPERTGLGDADRRLVLDVSDAAKDWLVLNGFDPLYGARPLRRLVQSAVGDRLAKGILAGALRLPNDQTGDCQMFTTRLAEMARELGVEFRFGRDIQRLEHQGDRLAGVWIDGQLETADRYVLALGS